MLRYTHLHLVQMQFSQQPVHCELTCASLRHSVHHTTPPSRQAQLDGLDERRA